jgi:hypothetical protein
VALWDRSHYDRLMSSHRAVVREGQVVELEEADPYSDELQLDADDRKRLDGMIEQGMSAARDGRTVSAKDLIDELDQS